MWDHLGSVHVLYIGRTQLDHETEEDYVRRVCQVLVGDAQGDIANNSSSSEKPTSQVQASAQHATQMNLVVGLQSPSKQGLLPKRICSPSQLPVKRCFFCSQKIGGGEARFKCLHCQFTVCTATTCKDVLYEDCDHKGCKKGEEGLAGGNLELLVVG